MISTATMTITALATSILYPKKKELQDKIMKAFMDKNRTERKNKNQDSPDCENGQFESLRRFKSDKKKHFEEN